MKKLLLLLWMPVWSGCGNHKESLENDSMVPQAILNEKGKTLEQRFNPPEGYHREAAADNSFTAYLRALPLKPHGAPVLYYNGASKPNYHVYAAVVQMDIGNKDLQQCADAVMRLRAEYLYRSKQYNKIHFNFTSGFRADYSRWREGYRVAFRSGKAVWKKRAVPDSSYENFRTYLETVFSYAGTLSLSRELQPVVYRDLQPGDVLIHGGTPGHAEMVADVAVNSMGHKVYLLAQSYMPAQETQVLENPDNAISPWYELDTQDAVIITPEWQFSTGELMRFGD